VWGRQMKGHYGGVSTFSFVKKEKKVQQKGEWSFPSGCPGGAGEFVGSSIGSFPGVPLEKRQKLTFP